MEVIEKNTIETNDYVFLEGREKVSKLSYLRNRFHDDEIALSSTPLHVFV